MDYFTIHTRTSTKSRLFMDFLEMKSQIMLQGDIIIYIYIYMGVFLTEIPSHDTKESCLFTT